MEKKNPSEGTADMFSINSFLESPAEVEVAGRMLRDEYLLMI